MEKVKTRNSRYNIYISKVPNWSISKKEQDSVLEFFEKYGLGKITNNITDESTREHYISYLKVALEFIKKDAEEITEQDIDNFANALIKNEILSGHNTPFAQSVKIKIRRTLLQYLDWRIPKQSGLINSSLKVKETVKNTSIKFLTEDEIDILYKNCKNNAERYLIAVLFSSGARASEFYNIRFNDINLPKEKESFVTLNIREEFSKTKGRTIKLYYKNSLEAVAEFLNERKKQNFTEEEPVWNIPPSTTQKKIEFMGCVKWLKKKEGKMEKTEIGRKILDKHLNFHLFRHSSATWMANKLNRHEMCYYFGWRFSSPMPDIYISRKGMILDQADKKFEQTELSELKTKISKQEYDAKLKNEEIETIKKEMETLKKLIMKGTDEDIENFVLANDEDTPYQEIKFDKKGKILS